MSDSRPSLWDFNPLIRLDRSEPYFFLQHATLFVSDQDRSLRFFVDGLGFNLSLDHRVPEWGRFVVVAPPDGTARLALVAPNQDSEDYPFIGKSRGIVFLTEDVRAKYEEWKKRGVGFLQPPMAALFGSVFTTLEDPDGNRPTVIEFDEATRKVESERRRAEEALEAERRAAQELQIARQVQARLFPQKRPGARTLEYAGVCFPARHVGGDYYDFLDLGGERLGLVVGDIAGKGIAAALLMANLQANLRSQCAIAADRPKEFLRSLNQLFYENTADGDYATFFFAEYDDRTRRLRYANCGHLPALLLRQDDTLERLGSTSTVLGLFEQWDCSLEERHLRSGDALLLYSDGITESFSEAGEEFGEQRLIEGLRRHRGLSPECLIASVVEEVREFNSHDQQDDITLIFAACRETAA